MSNQLIRRLLILGGLSIIGILFIQSYWLLKTWDIKDKEFDQSVNIVLRNVANRMATFNKNILPKTGVIQRKSSNYYAVNINTKIDAGILEQYLLQEMYKQGLTLDFEYAVYDCSTDELVYGNYCSESKSITDIDDIKRNKKLPKFNDLIYYFVVKFPNKESFLLANLNMTITLSLLSVIATIFFIYSMYVILEQKRLSELQRDFINNMTHEFKTPISSIKIASDFLANDPRLRDDVRLAKYAQIIKDQNQRLNDQVEKVLNIARVEKNSIEIKKEIISVNQTLRKIVANESLKLKADHIEYIPIESDVKIQADALHFVNIVSNLIDNAVKYSKNEPKVQLICDYFDEGIVIKIIDEGIGIDKEQQKKLFDKFYRVSTGDVHNVKGFGLGLYYVKNICSAHGWQIDVHSQLGEGSTFTIKIPKIVK
ncbi:MAG: HAMP domain-containing sensor histidine kinase [Saprospiraceae bacterium]